jgi:hypothetical protein
MMPRHSALLLVLAPLAFASVALAQSDTTDPRAHLKPGLNDAGVAAKGMELVAHRNKPDVFHPDTPGGLTYANSDLAFGGHYLYQGNFSGFEIWDIADPANPTLTHAEVCFTEQGDVSIDGHLLFVSAENTGNRLDCGAQGVQDSVSKDRMVGIRIFDVSDPKNPKQVADIQTCRGSHTHTLVPDPTDKGIVYVYVSGLARVRSSGEMTGCVGTGGNDPTSALFRIEIIRVPLANPASARIVSTARVFNDLAAVTTHGLAPADTANGAVLRVPRRYLSQVPGTASAADSARIGHLFSLLFLQHGDSVKMAPYADSLRQAGVALQLPPEIYHPTGPSQCHDITVYPAAGLAGGACSGYGLLLNIKDPVHPVRLDAASDSNFAFWHSATFSNDASKMIFTDEWGGGTQAKCRATDPINWGADRIMTIDHNKLTAVGYYKMPAAQTSTENCVAHNGSLVPVPGRDIITQGWYQGGASVVDITDPLHPKEIAYFDRGPIDSTKLLIGGYWSTYYYNGYIYGSEIARGIDVLKLTPTADLTQNEIDAANLVRFRELNVQEQPKLVWPAAFPVARAYLDQLVRDSGLPEARTTAIASALQAAEQAKGATRTAVLQKLAVELDRDAKNASDAPRVRALAKVVRGLEAPKA